MEYFNNVVQIIKFTATNTLKEGMNFIDATLGNGNDFVYLKKLVGDSGVGYGFDIQKDAVKTTINRIKEYNLEKNSIIINDGHENIDLYVDKLIDCCVFNLGYLPKGDHKIVTKSKTTIEAIKKVMKKLNYGGRIFIASYRGHIGGDDECKDIEKFLSNVDQKEYNISRIEFINQSNMPPKLFIIEKRKNK